MQIISSCFFETYQHLKEKTIAIILRSELLANENSQQHNGRVLCILMSFYVEPSHRSPAVSSTSRYKGAKIKRECGQFLKQIYHIF